MENESLKIKNRPLPPHLKRLMKNIYELIEVDKFYLYGGAPIDLLIDRKSVIKDLDIAIKGQQDEQIDNLVNNLKIKKFKIIESRREYFIKKNKKVILVYAEKGNIFFDIGFFNESELEIGLYCIESSYCRYPELDYIDKFDSIKSIKNKIIYPISDSLDDENPYLLISRFLYICAKYNISMLNNNRHRNIILELRDKVRSGEKITSQYLSCLSSVFKSILISKNRLVFISELVMVEIIKIIFPELNKSLKNILNNQSKIRHQLKFFDSKQDFILFFCEFLDNKDRKKFIKKIKLLQSRHWDIQDSTLNFNNKG